MEMLLHARSIRTRDVHEACLQTTTADNFEIAVACALGNNARGRFHSLLVRGIQSMATKIQAALRAAALVGSFAIVTGCASVTTEQLDAVRATAEAAQNAANAAQRTATQAQQAASGAQSTANQALQAAQAAQACCDATNQRVDRMFEQSQAK
jgi:hypothetical protein